MREKAGGNSIGWQKFYIWKSRRGGGGGGKTLTGLALQRAYPALLCTNISSGTPKHLPKTAPTKELSSKYGFTTMSGPRWKYPKARSYALENPISNVYGQLQALPPMKSFLSQTAVILQADNNQSELLNSVCIGRPVLVGPQASLSCSDGVRDSLPCEENAQRETDNEMLLYELTFEEAFFLSNELKCLQVSYKRKQDNDLLSDEMLWQLMGSHKLGFSYYYKAYSHLRKKNWIVRTGLQYGVHYIAYRHHPSNVHAEYAVIVVPEWEKQMQLSSWSHLQGIIRLCGNVAKTLLLLHVTQTDFFDSQHPRCLEHYSIKEMEVKRWLPQKHRMDNCMEPTGGQIKNGDEEQHEER